MCSKAKVDPLSPTLHSDLLDMGITADWLQRNGAPYDALGSLPPARYREQLMAAEMPV